jgi:hypothetical protein
MLKCTNTMAQTPESKTEKQNRKLYWGGGGVVFGMHQQLNSHHSYHLIIFTNLRTSTEVLATS